MPIDSIFDPIIDKQYERKAHEICVPQRMRLVIDDLVHRLDEKGSPIGQFLADQIKGHEETLSEAMAETALDLLLGDNQAMGGDIRPVMRNRIRRQLRIEAQDKYPTRTLKQIRDAVDLVTDGQIEDAVRSAVTQHAGASGISDIWQYLKDHWLEIAGIVLSILIAFI